MKYNNWVFGKETMSVQEFLVDISMAIDVKRFNWEGEALLSKGLSLILYYHFGKVRSSY